MNDPVGHLTTTYSRCHPVYTHQPTAVADIIDSGLVLPAQRFGIRAGEGTHFRLSNGGLGFIRILEESGRVVIISTEGNVYDDINSCNSKKSGELAAAHLMDRMYCTEGQMFNARVPVDPDFLHETRSVPHEFGIKVGKKFCALLSNIPDDTITKEGVIQGKFEDSIPKRYREHSLHHPFNPGITIEHISPYGHSGLHSYQECSGSLVIVMEDLEGEDISDTLDRLVREFKPRRTAVIGPQNPVELRETALSR